MIKILFFANENCESCDLLLGLLKKYGIVTKTNFEYIDALSESMQDFCDEHNVDLLPHIKVFHNKDVIYEKRGIFNPERLKNKIDKIKIAERKLKSIFKL